MPERGAEDWRVLRALCRGVADQAVGIEGVGGVVDALESEDDVFFQPDLADLFVDGRRFFRAAKLGLQIGGAVHAASRHVGVEGERSPDDLDRVGRPGGQGALQPALADEAPRADHVGDNLNMHGFRPPPWQPV